jgi:hypothetical protein
MTIHQLQRLIVELTRVFARWLIEPLLNMLLRAMIAIEDGEMNMAPHGI